MKWNVYYYSINQDEIKCFNIFDHGRFLEDVVKNLKKRYKKEEFKEKFRRDVMYYFWSKSEWELVIDVEQTEKKEFNFEEFANKVKKLSRSSKVTEREFNEFLCMSLLPSCEITLKPWIGRESIVREAKSQDFFMCNLDVYSEIIRKLAKKKIDDEDYKNILRTYIPCSYTAYFNIFEKVFEGESLKNKKIDIYNQIIIHFDLLIDYVWSNKKKLIDMYNNRF